jgi:hypothetical protein
MNRTVGALPDAVAQLNDALLRVRGFELAGEALDEIARDR